MSTAEKIKGAIRNISKKTGVNPNSLLQMCLFEGVLEKLSRSRYRDHFILKGGLLISSLIGVDMRSTMDMDTTIKGIPVNQEAIRRVINEILEVEIESEIKYHLIQISPIRSNDVYKNFSARVSCTLGKINAILNIDITTGDVITPSEMSYCYPRILDEGVIPIRAYTIETILAEKFETITSRNITTTRARDFYDLYMIYKLYSMKIDTDTLREAIERTSRHRGTFDSILMHKEVAKMLYHSESIKSMWKKFVMGNIYAKEIQFLDTIAIYEKVGEIFDCKNTLLFDK
ncbi:nucleotidyl transferase AbiEii/AbiGii toxin family protein [Guggenheimella bovis]